MSELISGKEALIALANGEEVEYIDTSNTFKSLGWGDAFGLETNLFFSDRFKFRLKPRTITLNGIEVPSVKYVAPSGDNFVKISCECPDDAVAISSALRSIFGKK